LEKAFGASFCWAWLLALRVAKPIAHVSHTEGDVLMKSLTMTKKINVAALLEFDIAEHLDTDQAVAEYLTIVMEENDLSELTAALGSIARARGMAEVARASCLMREAL